MAETEQTSANRTAETRYSPDELERIVRRAAELQAAEGDRPLGAFSEDEVIRISADVGLDASHVRRALRELATRLPEEVIPQSHPWLDRLFGDAVVEVTRSVEMDRQSLQAAIEVQFEQHGLQPIRQGSGISVWEPGGDLEGMIRRGLDFSGRRYRLAGSESVSLSIQALDEQSSQIHLFTDLSKQRNDYISGWGVGLFVTAVVGFSVLGSLAPLLAVAGFAIAAVGASALAVLDTRRNMQKNRRIYRLVLEGIVDRARSSARH